MNPKMLVYDLDPIWNVIKELQNRVAVLEGKEPTNIPFCKACEGKGFKETLITGNDDLTVKCRFCKGEGK